MSNLQIIIRLTEMLNQAQDLIKQQAILLAMHGIETEDGQLEAKRTALLEEIEQTT